MAGRIEERGSSAARGYDAQWRRSRLLFLQQHPLCCYCEAAGLVTAATVVDHKIPHRGDRDLFWNRDNWQAMCKTHHDAAKQREEHAGSAREIGLDGWPKEDA